MAKTRIYRPNTSYIHQNKLFLGYFSARNRVGVQNIPLKSSPNLIFWKKNSGSIFGPTFFCNPKFRPTHFSSQNYSLFVLKLHQKSRDFFRISNFSYSTKFLRPRYPWFLGFYGPTRYIGTR